ncbi:hypothetical protein AB0I28_07850 [Phytomonospora sp. NPDC050363]|uniref:hypothetical protein n=1 Tax=Phytomonospora sp. NPDC050363 TaxID=3155642 RepID=UPI0033ED24F8
METIEALVDEHLLRFSDGIFELFSRRSFDSTRIPVQWLAVTVGEPKRGQIRINFTRDGQAGSALYRSLPEKLARAGSSYLIPEGSEPGYREFFTRVAAATGRTVTP